MKMVNRYYEIYFLSKSNFALSDHKGLDSEVPEAHFQIEPPKRR